MAFGDKPSAISEYLKHFERERIIKFALVLIYHGDEYSSCRNYIKLCICKENADFIDKALKRIKEHCTDSPEDITSVIPRKYILVGKTTGLLLLKHAFSIDKYEEVAPSNILEQYLLKVILLLNQEQCRGNVTSEYDNEGNYSEMFYAKTFIHTSIKDYDQKSSNVGLYVTNQIIKGYYFLEFCEKSNLSNQLTVFLSENGFTTWQQYLYNVVRLITYALNKENDYPIISIQSDDRTGRSFLSSLSFNIKERVPLDQNFDFSYFKAHPIIKVNESTYIPINSLFCINQSFRSLYFKLKAINENLKNTNQYNTNIRQYITTYFSEQILFQKIVRSLFGKKHGVEVFDKPSSSESNLPDYYYRDGNVIFLFENKDILLSDKVIESPDFSNIEGDLHKKLIKTKGIPQLIKNIEAINNRQFKWDKHISNNPRIYPILVIDDISLCVPGLNSLLNNEFQNQLNDKKLNIKVYPMTVVELDSLIAFYSSFQEKKHRFKDTLDRYQAYLTRSRKHITDLNQVLDEVYHKFYPFYTYLRQEEFKTPYDSDLFEKICDKIGFETKGTTTYATQPPRT
jgi:hypothetical protein